MPRLKYLFIVNILVSHFFVYTGANRMVDGVIIFFNIIFNKVMDFIFHINLHFTFSNLVRFSPILTHGFFSKLPLKPCWFFLFFFMMCYFRIIMFSTYNALAVFSGLKFYIALIRTQDFS